MPRACARTYIERILTHGAIAMTFAKHRRRLPQTGDTPLLTDGGVETTLIFHEGFDLPFFAAFPLLRSTEGRRALRRHYLNHLRIARARDVGFLLDSATWRASRAWGAKLGYDDAALAEANRAAVEMLLGLRTEFETARPIVVSGDVGPRSDGYAPEEIQSPEEAEDYHDAQIATLGAAGVDMISAVTMTHAGEALGIARACARRELPLALSFTVETDGRLPTGQPLGEAIQEIDGDPCGGPNYYMINCAHPDHFREILERGSSWAARIRGLMANASRQSHAELDAAESLDEGDPIELAADYAGLRALLPNLRVFGGCCGTDHRHIDAIAAACLPRQAG